MKYQVFISYSREDAKAVNSLIRLLKAAFPQVGFWLDTDDMRLGTLWEKQISQAISHSDLVLVICSCSSCLSPHVQEEVRIAADQGKKLLPVKIDPKCKDRDITSSLPALAKRQRIDGMRFSNLEGLERLISFLRDDYADRLSRNVRVFDAIEDMIGDITKYGTSRFDIFMIDGGTTLRRVLKRDFLDSISKQRLSKTLNVRGLFVDTLCRNLVESSIAGKGAKKHGEFENVSDDAFCSIFEGILQGSRWIHNNGPHEKDLDDSVDVLTGLNRSHPGVFNVETRAISILPVCRLIITDSFCYVPAFLPLEDGLTANKLDYYALRFAADSKVYDVMNKYFNHYWSSARLLPAKSDNVA